MTPMMKFDPRLPTTPGIRAPRYGESILSVNGSPLQVPLPTMVAGNPPTHPPTHPPTYPPMRYGESVLSVNGSPLQVPLPAMVAGTVGGWFDWIEGEEAVGMRYCM